jgi:transposase
LLTRWRREYRSGLLGNPSRQAFVPLAISPPEASSRHVTAKSVPGGDIPVTVDLVNGRRLTIPTTIDPDILARLLPVLDAL